MRLPRVPGDMIVYFQIWRLASDQQRKLASTVVLSSLQGLVSYKLGSPRLVKSNDVAEMGYPPVHRLTVLGCILSLWIEFALSSPIGPKMISCSFIFDRIVGFRSLSLGSFMTAAVT